jgi:hypothetical protein
VNYPSGTSYQNDVVLGNYRTTPVTAFAAGNSYNFTEVRAYTSHEEVYAYTEVFYLQSPVMTV